MDVGLHEQIVQLRLLLFLPLAALEGAGFDAVELAIVAGVRKVGAEDASVGEKDVKLGCKVVAIGVTELRAGDEDAKVKEEEVKLGVHLAIFEQVLKSVSYTHLTLPTNREV